MSYYFSFGNSICGLADYVHRFDIVYKIFAVKLGFTYVVNPEKDILQHVNGDKKFSDELQKFLGFYDYGIPYSKVNFESECKVIINQFNNADEVVNHIKSIKKENVLYKVELVYIDRMEKYLKEGVVNKIGKINKNEFESDEKHDHFKNAYQSDLAKKIRQNFLNQCSVEEQESNVIVHIRRNDTGVLFLESFNAFLKPEYREFKYYDIFRRKGVNKIENIGKREQRPYASTLDVFNEYEKAIKKTNLERNKTIVFSDLYSHEFVRLVKVIFQGDEICQKELAKRLIDYNTNLEYQNIKKLFNQETLILGESPKSTLLLIYKYLECDLIVSTKTGKFEILHRYFPYSDKLNLIKV